MSADTLTTIAPESVVVQKPAPELFPPLSPDDITRLSVIGRTDLNYHPDDVFMNSQILDLVRVKDGTGHILLPLHYNLRAKEMVDKIAGLTPNSLADFFQNITLSGRGGIASDELVEKFTYCQDELGLSPLFAAVVSDRLTKTELKHKYNPLGQKTKTRTFGITGSSRSLKTTFLAVENFKGNLPNVCGIEPFSDWSLDNMLEVLNHSKLDPSTATDDELITAIGLGVNRGVAEHAFPKPISTLGGYLDKVLPLFETGVARPPFVIIDLPGLPSNRDRPLQSPDLVTFCGVDVLLKLDREMPEGQTVYNTDGDPRILSDYRAQFAGQIGHILGKADNTIGEWLRKLTWDMPQYVPKQQLVY